MQGEEEDSDLSAWATIDTRFGDKNLVMGSDGLTDKESFLSKSFRYYLALSVTVTVTVTVTVKPT